MKSIIDFIEQRSMLSHSENITEKQNFLIKGHTKNQNKQTFRFVDLGLPSKTMWADRNLGATKPEEVGDYYAWGMVEPGKEFTKNEYKFYKTPQEELTKYSRRVDNLKTLEDEDDAAFVNSNGKAVMPTGEQIDELQKYTTIEFTRNYNNTHVDGFIITGKNKKSIFIPCNKTIYDSREFFGAKNVKETFALWTKDLSSAPAWARGYYGYHRDSSWGTREETYIYRNDDFTRYHGYPIRPVKNN